MMAFKIKLFLILLLVPIVYAQFDLIDLTPQNTVLSPGEVYQTEIVLTNPITELKKTNIKLYSNDNLIPVSPFLSELNSNHYYLFFEIPRSLEEGDYKLKIEDQSFLVNGILQPTESIENITLTDSQPSVSITPGFFLLPFGQSGQISIITESKDIATNIFFLTPDYMTHPYITEQSINSQVPRTFTFDYDTSNAINSELIVNAGSKQYKIPIFIEGQIEENTNNESTIDQETNPFNFFVEDNHLRKTLKHDKTIEGNLYLSNNLNITISKINSEFTNNLGDVISITPSQFTNILPNSNFTTYMVINPSKDVKEGVYSGELILSYEQYNSKLKITIIVEGETSEWIDTEYVTPPTQEAVEEEASTPIETFVPWNLSGGYEEESKSAASPFMYLIIIFLAISIMIFLLSGKKSTKKKSFSQLVSESQK